MATIHTAAQQLWELMPALTTGLRFGTAVLTFGLAASAVWTQIRSRSWPRLRARVRARARARAGGADRSE